MEILHGSVPGRHLPSRVPAKIAAWLAGPSGVEVVIVVAITLVAALARLWALGDVPVGLHGDEAWTGLDAQRIQAEGWIGPYVESALGQPAGPPYWAAIVLAFVDDTAYTVRLSMALLGILTVPVLYLAARPLLGREVAAFSAFFLAVMSWHLFFSRIAFMVISWPLLEVVCLVFLFAAIKRDSLVLFVLAGIALGLGIYTYNVYPMFVVAVVCFAIVQILSSHASAHQLRAYSLAGLTAFIAAVPMLIYVVEPSNDYFGHHRRYSLLHTDAFKEAAVLGKIELLLESSWDWLVSIVWSAPANGVEGTVDNPALDPLTILLVVLGIAICIKQIRNPASQLLIIILVLLPIGSTVSIEPGFRRGLGLVPIVAILAALPLAMAWKHRFDTRNARIASRVAIAAVLALFAFTNVRNYHSMATSDLANWVFARELAAASAHLGTLPEDTYVYFLSNQASFNYETRRYLAPNLQGEDRSEEFGTRHDFDVDRSRDSLVLLLGPYIKDLPEIAASYPDGESFVAHEDDRELFATFTLAAIPVLAPPDESPAADPRDRDEIRVAELEALSLVLERYKSREGAYPSTSGNSQATCVYEGVDRLCQLVNDVGLDLLKDPQNGGYWYASDGEKFSLFALFDDDDLNQSCDTPFFQPRDLPPLGCITVAP